MSADVINEVGGQHVHVRMRRQAKHFQIWRGHKSQRYELQHWRETDGSV